MSHLISRPRVSINHGFLNHRCALVSRHLMGVVLVLIGLAGSLGIVAADNAGGADPVMTSNQRVADRLFDEVFVQQKPGVCALLMTTDAVTHTPTGNFAGPEGFEKYVAEVWALYSDATFLVDEGVANGNLMTFRWSIADEQGVRLQGRTTLRFEQSMIAESWFEYDSDALTRQPVVTPGAPEPCPPCREP